MNPLQTLTNWYGKKVVFGSLGLIAILIILGFFGLFKQAPEEEVSELLPTIVVARADAETSRASLKLVGNVKALSQADLQSETSGRVTNVNVTLGQAVGAGAVIAQLESASERASVLQAEGAYEAALASAAESDTGTQQAENDLRAAKDNVVTAFRSTFTTANNIVLNTLDQLYSNPTDGVVPGLIIEAVGRPASYFNNERIALRSTLEEWQIESATVSIESDLDASLNNAETDLLRLGLLIDAFLVALSQGDNNNKFSDAQIDTLQSSFVSARTSIDGILGSIDGARTQIVAAEEALERAQIAGSGNSVSSSDAAVKQALGSLRAAQAQLAKTVITTPIAGTVNAINVDTGDFVGSFQSIATVANNAALEITTFVGDSDLSTVFIGQPVTIEDQYSGVVTNVAPSVDPITKKTEVKIATESDAIANGDTVAITLEATATATATDTNTSLFIPITAVKFTETNGVVFTVVDNTLIANPVEIGEIRGSFVEIVSGITAETIIVVDGRGRAAGQKVEAIQN